MLETVLPLARSGNFKAITAAVKLIGAQNLILGICQPNAPVVQINNTERPPTSTDKIELALFNLLDPDRQAEENARRVSEGRPPFPAASPAADPSTRH